jgi:hypothetical protein
MRKNDIMKITTTRIAFTAILVGGCFVTYAISAHLTKAKLAASVTQAAPKPFWIQQQVVGRDSDGKYTLTENRITAFSSSGANAIIVTRPNKPEYGPSRLVVRPNGFGTFGLEKFSVKMSGFLSSRRMEANRKRLANILGSCHFANEKEVGAEEILGVKVLSAVYDTPNGFRETTWRAVDYGCETVKKRVEQKTAQGWSLKLEVVPVAFTAGEPDPALFSESLFSKFEELPPSAARDRVYRALGETPTSCPKCFSDNIKEQDDQYWSHQVQR